MAGLALLLSCGSGIPDTQRHDAVLSAPLDEVRLEDCAEIRSDDLRGDCQLYAAQVLGRTDGFGELCVGVDDGVWRDECYFLAAEQARRIGEDKRDAGRLCARSGRFANDCAQHLWQTGLKRTVDANSDDLERVVTKTRALYCYWEPVLGEDTDFRVRFWQRAFSGWYERHQELDPSMCDALEPAAADHCHRAAGGLYLRRLHMAAAQDPGVLCGPDPSVQALSDRPNLAAVDTPLFQELLTLQAAWACSGEGGMAPAAEPLLAPTETIEVVCR